MPSLARAFLAGSRRRPRRPARPLGAAASPASPAPAPAPSASSPLPDTGHRQRDTVRITVTD
ncbi:MAG: hypothetical protein ACRELB_22415, partial [Polyangiaceae bacterium]